jgi:hypothetical protein
MPAARRLSLVYGLASAVRRAMLPARARSGPRASDPVASCIARMITAPEENLGVAKRVASLKWLQPGGPNLKKGAFLGLV